MIEEVKQLKQALRIIDAKYVSSKIENEYIFIRFTYKNKNYIIHINTKYKIMFLEQTTSCKENNINDDTLGLIEDLRMIKSYLEFENYSISAITIASNRIGENLEKKLEYTIPSFSQDIKRSIETLDLAENQVDKIELIEYDDGLNTFDIRIFNEDWLEDFNEKISTYNEKDLYIIYITLISYFYKVLNNKWEGYKIDPFVINYGLEVILEELEKRKIDINDWYNKCYEYFLDEGFEKYLSNKQKRKK